MIDMPLHRFTGLLRHLGLQEGPDEPGYFTVLKNGLGGTSIMIHGRLERRIVVVFDRNGELAGTENLTS